MGIWRAGGIAAPLCVKHPLTSIKYVLDDTQAEIVIFSKEFKNFLEPLERTSAAAFLPAESFDNQKKGT